MCPAAAPRPPRRRRPARARPRTGPRRSRVRRAHGSGGPTRPAPRGRCRALARRMTPARPCAGHRSSTGDRRAPSDRRASRRRACSRTVPWRAQTERSTSTPYRRRRRRRGRRHGSSESAISTARTLDAQTLLIVSEGTSTGSPARIAACRAGAWPAPPCSTWPMITYSTSAPSSPARSTAARTAIAPSSVAGFAASAPPRRPKGVRTAETITERLTPGD